MSRPEVLFIVILSTGVSRTIFCRKLLLVVSAVFTMGAKLEPQPIEGFENVAGEWKGSGRIPSYSTAFSVILIIHEDGSYKSPGTDLMGSRVSAMARSTFSLISQGFPLLLRFTRMGESAS